MSFFNKNMITKLPKSMWLMNAAITAGMVVGTIAFLLVRYTESEVLGRLGIIFVVVFWVIAVAAWAFNIVRQCTGAYKGMEPTTLRKQRW